MSNQGLLAAGLTGLLAAVAGGGVVLHLCDPRGQEPRLWERSWSSSSWEYPPDATTEQRLALSKHIAEGAPLPAGFTLIDDVSGALTGVVDRATGEREIKVEVTTASAEIDEVRLYVDDELRATATRANGGIADHAAEGISVATLSAWIPPSGRSWSASVRWDGADGFPRGSTHSIHVPWFKELLARIFPG